MPRGSRYYSFGFAGTLCIVAAATVFVWPRLTNQIDSAGTTEKNVRTERSSRSSTPSLPVDVTARPSDPDRNAVALLEPVSEAPAQSKPEIRIVSRTASTPTITPPLSPPNSIDARREQLPAFADAATRPSAPMLDIIPADAATEPKPASTPAVTALPETSVPAAPSSAREPSQGVRKTHQRVTQKRVIVKSKAAANCIPFLWPGDQLERWKSLCSKPKSVKN